MPFKFGPEYRRVLEESLEFWKEQGLPDDVGW
jgi:predicted phosphoadenosine phosphosulfate sulfurtransferase